MRHRTSSWRTASLLLLVVWFDLIHAQQEKSPSALTVVEGSDGRSGGVEQQVEDDGDPEDLEVFQPSDKWQTLRPGQAVPPGSHVRLNLQTGQREVKLGEEQTLKYLSDGNREGTKNMQGPSFTTRELKEALKKFKDGVEEPTEEEGGNDEGEGEGDVRAKFRPLEELKRDMAALDMMVETDAQILRRLLVQFNSSNNTMEEKLSALLELEYLVHQVDNAQNLVSMGGMRLVIDALNSSDPRLQENAAFVLGSAVSSNPGVQVEAVEGGALQKLLTLLATPRPMAVKKKVLFAMASLMRQFPFAQSQFLKLGGVHVLGELFKVSGGEVLRVRIITVLYDMIIEKELISQSGLDPVPDSSHQERVRQYGRISLLPLLAEQGWCSLVPELLESPEHDWREKALRTLLAMMPTCRGQYLKNQYLGATLVSLQKQYRELALTEQNLGEEDGYFGELLDLVDSMILKLQ